MVALRWVPLNEARGGWPSHWQSLVAGNLHSKYYPRRSSLDGVRFATHGAGGAEQMDVYKWGAEAFVN